MRSDRPALSIVAMSLKRHVAWLAAAAAFSVAVLPVLVYYTGAATLGPYSGGGLRQFLRDYVINLAGLQPAAWLLLVGPVLLVAAWRVLVALLWPRVSRG